jgi:hypothetical protein
VGFRELLVWRTFGGMTNAAVMGVLAPVRYVLLTDALLEQMSDDQVEAVMAHELAHIRKRHLLWLVLVAGVALVAVETAAAVSLQLTGRALIHFGWEGYLPQLLSDRDAVAAASLGFAVVIWLGLFGWVSRRFERQADSFAVAHLARRDHDDDVPHPGPEPDAPTATIQANAITTMVAALDRVAELNNITPTRRSWRHGSIRWRQRYLRSLEGLPVTELPIDRVVNWIIFLTAATLLVMITASMWTPNLPIWL